MKLFLEAPEIINNTVILTMEQDIHSCKQTSMLPKTKCEVVIKSFTCMSDSF